MPTKPHSIPAPVRVPVLLAGALAAFAALAGLGVALFGLGTVLWATAAFTLVSFVASVLAILAGLGRFSRGYGMATLCVAGTIAVAAGFAMIDLRPNLTAAPELARLLKPWVALQVGGAGVIAAAGAVEVLLRRKASWARFFKGVALLAPAVILLALAAGLWTNLTDGPNGRVISLAMLLFGGLIVGALVSAGGHQIIRAFELAGDEPDDRA